MASKLHILKRCYSSTSLLWPLLALVTGGFIYILLRPVEPVFFSWIRTIGLESLLAAARGQPDPPRGLSSWMVYSLPNGLWAFAYTFLMISLWRSSRSVVKYIWYLSIPLLVFGFEILQLSGIRGTFCWNDILLGALGILTGVITSGLVRKAHLRSFIRKVSGIAFQGIFPVSDNEMNQP